MRSRLRGAVCDFCAVPLVLLIRFVHVVLAAFLLVIGVLIAVWWGLVIVA